MGPGRTRGREGGDTNFQRSKRALHVRFKKSSVDMGDAQTAAVFLQASRGAWGAVRKVVESGEISKDTQVCCAPR